VKRKELIEQIRLKKTFLCVGLDPDTEKMPKDVFRYEDPVFEFNRAIIDSTANYCVAYKPNTAFYEALGIKGWIALEKTIQYLKKNYPNHFTIADAKRGDIGNTSSMYAKAFLQEMQFDSITVAPYMGSDSVKPFLSLNDKWVILLALTSNQGAFDFQVEDCNGMNLFERVLSKSMLWGNNENMMFVVGATKTELLLSVRKIIPEHFLLIPGVGAQGGSLKAVCEHGLNKDVGLLVNASRSIIYASGDKDFAEAAGKEASSLANEMSAYIN
jgi:orotidine-5'-phosphate decarboxylase